MIVGLFIASLLALPVAASHGMGSGGAHANDVYGLALAASRANASLTWNDVYGLRASAEASTPEWNDVFRIRLSGLEAER